jgi:5-methylcytosine-specific restriction endonuclease McrA
MTVMGMKKDIDKMQKQLWPKKRTAMVRRPGKKVRKKKTPLKKLHEKCWKMAGLVVKLRDNYTCQHCGANQTGKGAHTSHVLPKSTHGALRYVLENLKCLCYHCHMNWWHKNPMEAAVWFANTFPARWAKIKAVPRLRRYREDDLQEILEELTIEYERLSK